MVKQTDTSRRVLRVADYLIENHLVINEAEFVEILGYSHISFMQVRSGRRNFPLARLRNICDIFGVRIEYLMRGIQPMFSRDYINADRHIWARSARVTRGKNGIVVKYIIHTGENKIIEFIISGKA
jgi:hypothetical protein